MILSKTNRFGPRTFFHTILFAYQKKLKQILGSGEAIFVHPVLDTITIIEKEKQYKFIEGDNLDEVFENYANELMKSGAAKDAFIEKLGHEKYKLCVDGCSYSEHVHDLIKPKDVACPYALIAMSLFQQKTGKKVKYSESMFSSTGAETIIEQEP